MNNNVSFLETVGGVILVISLFAAMMTFVAVDMFCLHILESENGIHGCFSSQDKVAE